MYNPIGNLLTQLIECSDSYKHSHWSFTPPGFTSEYAYIEARKGGEFKEVQFFGLQYVLKFYLSQTITHEMIDEAESFIFNHGLPYNRKLWERVVNKHGGRVPVRICALQEGIIVPQGTVLSTVESTDPECAEIACMIETLLLRGVWFPTTIATRSMRWWRLIHRYLEMTGDPLTSNFKLVDFGARGVTSTESAGIAGMAHLVNHEVTDNLFGIRFAQRAYNTRAMVGFSIPASEHSVTTAWGREGEMDFFRHVLATHGQNREGPRKPVSIVIDTYDQDEAVGKWLRKNEDGGLREDLIASNMQLVLRPDSGDPVQNVVHLLDLVGSYVGWTVNEKGYRVLPDFVRLIQGDGINEESLRFILQRVAYYKWSVDNLAFGSGGGLLVHDVERDTHRFAMKASEVIVNGEVRAIQKNPATDPSKASKAGRFAVVYRDERYQTIAEKDLGEGEENLLIPVFENGEFLKEYSFETVRNLASLARMHPPEEEAALLRGKKAALGWTDHGM